MHCMYLKTSKKKTNKRKGKGEKRRFLIHGGGATTAMTTYCQVLPDGKILRLDIAQVQLVCKVVFKVPHQVQEAQCNVIGCLPGVGPALRGCHVFQGEDILVPGATGRQVLYGVEVSAGSQDLGHMAAQVLQDPTADSRVSW